MKENELIGKIITVYDPGMSETWDEVRGTFRAQFEYDPDCEEWYIVTGILKTSLEVVLFGIEMYSYMDADKANEVDAWMDEGRPFAIFMNESFNKLLDKKSATGHRMNNLVSGIMPYGYKFGDKLLWWNVYNGTPEEFIEIYERED